MFFKSKKKDISVKVIEKQLFKIIVHNVDISYLVGIMRGINYKIKLKEIAILELLLSNFSALLLALNMLSVNNDEYKKIFPKLMDSLHSRVYKYISVNYNIDKDDFNKIVQQRQEEYLNLIGINKEGLGEKIYLNLSAENEAPIYSKERDRTLCKMLGMKFFMITEMIIDFFKKKNIIN